MDLCQYNIMSWTGYVSVSSNERIFDALIADSDEETPVNVTSGIDILAQVAESIGGFSSADCQVDHGSDNLNPELILVDVTTLDPPNSSYIASSNIDTTRKRESPSPPVFVTKKRLKNARFSKSGMSAYLSSEYKWEATNRQISSCDIHNAIPELYHDLDDEFNKFCELNDSLSSDQTTILDLTNTLNIFFIKAPADFGKPHTFFLFF